MYSSTIWESCILDNLTSVEGLVLTNGITKLYLNINADVDVFIRLGAIISHILSYTVIDLNAEIIEKFNAINSSKDDFNQNSTKHK